jgi:hypothetical protein
MRGAKFEQWQAQKENCFIPSYSDSTGNFNSAFYKQQNNTKFILCYGG